MTIQPSTRSKWLKKWVWDIYSLFKTQRWSKEWNTRSFFGENPGL